MLKIKRVQNRIEIDMDDEDVENFVTPAAAAAGATFYLISCF
jgi:hypothetical protein